MCWVSGLSADLVIGECVAWLHRRWGELRPDLALQYPNVLPVVGAVIPQVLHFGAEALDLPFQEVHVALDPGAEGAPIGGFLGCLFDFG